ncbi:MAG: DUF4347 domain-containing protein, partial [Desulfobacteraceae bacterium]|nr:DUF4347 domain-containing protein [Desulfobacteraceae bacterium]
MSNSSKQWSGKVKRTPLAFALLFMLCGVAHTMFPDTILGDTVDSRVTELLASEAHSAVLESSISQPKTSEIVFIDSAVDDYQTLLQGISPDIEVNILDAKRNGLAQMAEILMGRSGIDAIHVVSHGQRGVLKLGATRIDQAA